MKHNSNRVVTLVLLGWLFFAVGLASWFYDASAPAVAATVWYDLSPRRPLYH